jgi:glycine cleavage system H protein
VPGGAFVYPGHTWARIDADGLVFAGLDDFARKTLKSIERVELPVVGTKVKRGDPLFKVRQGGEVVSFRSPVSGEVTQTNDALEGHPQSMLESPYDRGWACLIRPSELSAELDGLRIGKAVVSWYQDEVMRMRQELAASGAAEWKWADLEASFFGPGVATTTAVTETINS